MRHGIIAIAGTLHVLFGSGAATAAIDPPNPQDLTLGNWDLNMLKSHECPDSLYFLKSSHRRLFEVGFGYVTSEAHTINADGHESHVLYTFRYDGEKYPREITAPSSGYMTYRRLTPNYVEQRRYDHPEGKDDKLISIQSRTVSDDGQTMVVAERNPGGTCVTMYTYDRVK